MPPEVTDTTRVSNGVAPASQVDGVEAPSPVQIPDPSKLFQTVYDTGPTITLDRTPGPALQLFKQPQADVQLASYVTKYSGKSGDHDGPNCFSLLAAVGYPQLENTYVDTAEAMTIIKADWQPIPEQELRSGDVIVFGDYNHLAVYLGDGKVFQKPNWKYQAKYEIVPLSQATASTDVAYFNYALDRDDRMSRGGRPEIRQYERQCFRLANAPSIVPVDSLVGPASTQLASAQFFILQQAAINGANKFERPDWVFLQASGARQLATDIFNNPLTQALHRQASLDWQTRQRLRPVSDSPYAQKRYFEEEVPRSYVDNYVHFNPFFTAQLTNEMFVRGVPSDRISGAVREAEQRMKSKYTESVHSFGAHLSTMQLINCGYDGIVQDVAAKYAKQSVQVPEGIFVTPVDLLVQPTETLSLLAGSSDMIGYRPISSGVVFESARLMVADPKLGELANVERIRQAVEMARTARERIGRAK